jgi:Nuclease-related domain
LPPRLSTGLSTSTLPPGTAIPSAVVARQERKGSRPSRPFAGPRSHSWARHVRATIVRAGCKLLGVFRPSFPRRQQYRRVRRAAVSGAAALTAGALTAAAAYRGLIAAAGMLLLVMAGLLIDARRWVHLAERSRVGARSEGQVRQALAGLEAEGWRLRHSLPCGRGGDIDSIAIAPIGIAFAIETKARKFDARHLARARDTAMWLRRHRRRWCRRGALPVLCVVRAHGLEGVEDGVLVVSLDRLAPALRASAGTSPRPGFLAT